MEKNQVRDHQKPISLRDIKTFRASEKKKFLCGAVGKMQTDRITHTYAIDGITELTNRENNWKLKTSSKTEPNDLTDPFFL